MSSVWRSECLCRLDEKTALHIYLLLDFSLCQFRLCDMFSDVLNFFPSSASLFASVGSRSATVCLSFRCLRGRRWRALLSPLQCSCQTASSGFQLPRSSNSLFRIDVVEAPQPYGYFEVKRTRSLLFGSANSSRSTRKRILRVAQESQMRASQRFDVIDAKKLWHNILSMTSGTNARPDA